MRRFFRILLSPSLTTSIADAEHMNRVGAWLIVLMALTTAAMALYVYLTA